MLEVIYIRVSQASLAFPTYSKLTGSERENKVGCLLHDSLVAKEGVLCESSSESGSLRCGDG